MVSQLLCDIEVAETLAGAAERDAVAEQQLTASLRDTIRAAHLEIVSHRFDLFVFFSFCFVFI